MLHRLSSSRGFTLLEVITAVGVAGVIGALAVVATADTIIDARAKAEARVVVERLRAEHRAAREQRVGLKVTSTAHTVRYQHTRGPLCTLPVGDTREVTYDAATLVISPTTGACFNLRGEIDTGPPSSVIIGNPLGAGSGSGSGSTTTSEPTIAVRADMSGATSWVLPLRIDPAGIADLPAKRVGDSASIDEVITGANAFIDPAKTFTFTPPEGNITGAGDPNELGIEDPCLKFAPDNPPENCLDVTIN